jgi:hypothetical protein
LKHSVLYQAWFLRFTSFLSLSCFPVLENRGLLFSLQPCGLTTFFKIWTAV